MLNNPNKHHAGWPTVLRRGLFVASLWWAAMPLAGAAGVPQRGEPARGSGPAGVRLAARRQPAVYVPSVPACTECPAVLRPEDELTIRFQVFGRKGQPTRLRVAWGDGSHSSSNWDATGTFEVRLTHRYKAQGVYRIRSWQESQQGQRSAPLQYSLEVAPAPAGPTVVDLPRIQNSLGMEFVQIPAGSFVMGSPADEEGHGDFGDETAHPVTLTQGYYLQTTEVTQAQWRAVMGQNPSWFQGKKLTADQVSDQRPVEQVSWDDVQQFIQRLNQRGEGQYRLPTEAEWEYAARAGTSTPFGIGNGRDLDSRQANFYGNSPYGAGRKGLFRWQTTPVKSFAPNAWGLYDMHGNVYEWVQDWYGNYSTRAGADPSAAVRDPQGPSSGVTRAYRGGGWYSGAQYARSAYRSDCASPADRIYFLGFRLLRSP